MVNGEVQLQALVDGKKIVVTKASVRRDLQLEDANDDDEVARGGEWVWGSNRSGDEECFWSSPEKSPEKFSGGGVVMAGGEVIPGEEEVAVDAIPLATKPPSIVDWKIIKEGKIGYYQIIRADGNSKRYSLMIQMLKSFDREDLETL
ncbi:hypothetical protein Tco_0606251 [Tanacetum coccineum]